MKQLLFMIALTTVGTMGPFVMGPFVGVAVYYLFAVLRPNYMWFWALPPLFPWSQYVAVGTIAATAAAAIGLAPLVGPPMARHPGAGKVLPLFLLFGVWVTGSYFTAIDREIAGRWLPEYLKIFLMLAVASFVVRQVRQVWRLYTIAAGVLIYIAYEINYLYVETGRITVYQNGYGGLDNNGAGLMLAMGVPLAVYAWEGTRPWWRWGFLAAVPVLLHAVLMTYSRGAMVSLLAVAPVLAMRSKRRWQFAALGVALLFVVPSLAGQEIRERFFSVKQFEQDESANSRFDSWRAAFLIANDHPVFGVGIRNSALVVYDYGADMIGRTIHSQYLQIAADSGYPALALYLGALAAVWVSMAQTRRLLAGREDDEARLCRAMLSGLEGSLGVFCVGAVFLSLEVFELPYLIALMGGQLHVIVRAQSIPQGVGGQLAGAEAHPVNLPPARINPDWRPVAR